MRSPLPYGGPVFGPRKLALGAGCCLASGFGWGWLAWPAETKLTFLAVGQGDCTVFQHRGTTILIDGGPRAYGVDAGSRIVVPKLNALGVRSVDLILVSHPDEDHVGGIGAVLKAYPRARVAVSSEFLDHEGLAVRLKEWRMEPEDVLWMGSTQSLSLGEFSVRIANPDLPTGAVDNDGSSFVKIQSGSASVVLSGDASEPVENAVAELGDWSAQVMKVGHHGSQTSTGPVWLREVSPTYAIVSCGRDNEYGHPANQVVTRLNGSRVTTLRTDQQGDVVFVVDKLRGFVLNR